MSVTKRTYLIEPKYHSLNSCANSKRRNKKLMLIVLSSLTQKISRSEPTFLCQKNINTFNELWGLPDAEN